ncbi:MAG TPA: FliI/YscN family ATPase [Phycisphaerales bacterium]|nr:FliI/YscN family ATPase [Phycisphaerales bacterium]
MTVLSGAIDMIREMEPREFSGEVTAVRGLRVMVGDLPAPVGTAVRIESKRSAAERAGADLRGEVVGFSGGEAIVMLLCSSEGVGPGDRVVGEQTGAGVRVGKSMLGRVVNGLGEAIDGGRALADLVVRSAAGTPTSAMKRRRILEPMPTGVAVLDAMVTLGKGQRIGIFSGPGVGKSTLTASIARNTAADVNVIALIGERGREVKDFLEGALGVEGLKRSVVVVSTGDESALMRVRAATTATVIAEYFREEGADVMLIMDSVTRLAHAQRQIGLTAGETVATKGYTPSVFSLLPALMERAGAIEGGGSITGIYTVLVEGDDLTEPVSDAARGILDGHIALSRKLASRGHFPAVDLLESISRVANDVCDANHIAARRTLLKVVAAYAEAEELINIGAYARGSNPACDTAIAMKSAIDTFLQQDARTKRPYPETCKGLIELGLKAQQEIAQRVKAQQAVVSGPGGHAPANARKGA